MAYPLLRIPPFASEVRHRRIFVSMLGTATFAIDICDDTVPLRGKQILVGVAASPNRQHFGGARRQGMAQPPAFTSFRTASGYGQNGSLAGRLALLPQLRRTLEERKKDEGRMKARGMRWGGNAMGTRAPAKAGEVL